MQGGALEADDEALEIARIEEETLLKRVAAQQKLVEEQREAAEKQRLADEEQKVRAEQAKLEEEDRARRAAEEAHLARVRAAEEKLAEQQAKRQKHLEEQELRKLNLQKKLEELQRAFHENEMARLRAMQDESGALRPAGSRKALGVFAAAAEEVS